MGERVAGTIAPITERPTFASDDLLAELTDGGATVRATPLVQQRGFLTNLLISFAPILLLVGFYLWMFKRQQGAMAGGLLGGRKQTRVDPETGRLLRVDTRSRRLRERFESAAAEERNDVVKALASLGVRHLVLSTSGDWLRSLAVFLRRRRT